MTLIYLIAGEASGDVLGARLIAALRAQRPGLDCCRHRRRGDGGTGTASLFPMQDLALMGLLEVLPRLRHLRHRLHQTVADIAARRPDVVVTIDSPGFTLRVLKAIQPLGVKRAHYVAPQVWAWRESRVRHYPGLWDQLLCLLPFEPAFFARHGLPANLRRPPGAGKRRRSAAMRRGCARHGIDPSARVVTLMPGSRRTEVTRLLPILGATLQRLPDVVPVVPGGRSRGGGGSPGDAELDAASRAGDRTPGQVRRIRCLCRRADQVGHIDA